MEKTALYGLLGLLLVVSVAAREVKQDTLLETTVLLVDGHEFSFILAVDQGVVTHDWKVDGKAVDGETYEERLLDAEKEERRRALRREEAALVEEAQTRQQNRIEILKKLLTHYADECLAILERINQKGLKKLGFFEAVTLHDEAELERLEQEIIPAMRKKSNEEEAERELAYHLRRAEDYLARLKLFEQRSASKVIEQSDDPQVLKALLNTLS